MKVASLHNPGLDKIKHDALDFVGALGLKKVAPPDKVAMLLPSEGERLREELGKGPNVRAGHVLSTGEVYVIVGEGEGDPSEIQVQDTSLAVHELTHSDSMAEGEHPFYTESLAGMAEHAYLAAQAHRFPTRVDRSFRADGVSLHLPGEYRFFGNHDNPNATQALIGAYAVSLGLQASGVHPRTLFEKAEPGVTTPYDLMRYALAHLDTTLPDRIDQLPATRAGLIAAAGLVQAVARNHHV